MEDKEIEGAIQECFESIEKRTDLEFSYQWCLPKKMTKIEVVVTLAENSDEHHGGGKAGFSYKTPHGTHWICLFKKELKQMPEQHQYFKNDIKKAIKSVCIHEVLHTLDRIKNGIETKTEREIIKLLLDYMDKPDLRIEV